MHSAVNLFLSTYKSRPCAFRMRRRAALCRRGLAALTAAEAQRAEKIKTRPKSVRSDRRAVGMKPSEVREGERFRWSRFTRVHTSRVSTPGWTQRRQRFIPADAFCFPQLNCSSRHKNCLLSLSKPNALSCPFSGPPARLVSSPVSFSCYSGNPYIFISYLNVFQLPLSDLPLNHRPLPPALRRHAISFISLYF